jgi:hypothetical protein
MESWIEYYLRYEPIIIDNSASPLIIKHDKMIEELAKEFCVIFGLDKKDIENK